MNEITLAEDHKLAQEFAQYDWEKIPPDNTQVSQSQRKIQKVKD